MREFIAAHHGWLTVVRLRSAEGVGEPPKNGLSNLAVQGLNELAAVVKNRLKRIQYRPVPIDGFLAQSGLLLKSRPS
ncbi:putative transposase [Amycolatopsis sacchari]|uniref:Putative transposase n=1 Tax=Amycolatopsis sacchari TaxID=115433 RepID=A0A1I3ZFU8_9PSEU|nr:hypothetical protein [Amycolatopsis sacchari]SFK42935.1 putative transposase [Amycolatopsis sacchari]